jgi:hypothetical protein
MFDKLRAIGKYRRTRLTPTAARCEMGTRVARLELTPKELEAHSARVPFRPWIRVRWDDGNGPSKLAAGTEEKLIS